MTTAKYKKPSGVVFEIIDTPATREQAKQGGWVEVGVEKKAPAKKAAPKKKAVKKAAKKKAK